MILVIRLPAYRLTIYRDAPVVIGLVGDHIFIVVVFVTVSFRRRKSNCRYVYSLCSLVHSSNERAKSNFYRLSGTERKYYTQKVSVDQVESILAVNRYK